MTMRSMVLAAALAACGGKGQSQDTQQPTGPAPETGGAQGSPETGGSAGDPDASMASLSGAELVFAACAHMGEVHAKTPCEFLTRANFTVDGCQSEMDVSKLPPKMVAPFETAMRCVGAADQCDGFPECFATFQQEVSQSDDAGRACGEQGIGAVSLSADEASKRYGRGVTKLAKAPTSKEKPIEVCGVRAQHEWLEAAECNNGSKPLAKGGAAGARVGSVGAGGRCQSVIDRYEVQCPEKRYEVFMDLYMCGPGESI